MGKRTNLVSAVETILRDTGLFRNIYKEPTDIEKERSFPVAWITVGPEVIQEGEMTSSNYMRVVTLDITIGVKHKTVDTSMNDLVDTIFETMKTEYTLNGAAINLVPIEIMTDRGYFHPYAFASLIFKVWVR